MVHVIWSTFVSRLAPLIYDAELYIYARISVPESNGADGVTGGVRCGR